jgi:MFS family permease
VAYRWLWSTQSLSAIGTMAMNVTVAVQVYDITQSSLAVGLIGLAHAVPLTVVSLFGASLVDAVDRRRLAMVTSSLLAVVALAFAAQSVLGLGLVWLLLALTMLQSMLFAIDAPTTRTFVPRLVRTELIPSAAALSQLSFQVSLVGGSVLGGAVIAATGTTTAYLLGAAGFLIALYGVGRLPPMPVQNGGSALRLRAALDGLRFVARNRTLLTVFIVDLVATLLAMPMALFPALAAENFDGGPDVVGLLYAAPAIGGLLGAIFSGGMSRVRRQGVAVLVAAAIWGATIAAFGLTSMLWLAVSLLAVAGAADMVGGVFRTTLLQVETPDGLRGRVNALGFLVDQAGPNLGGVRAGAVAVVATPAMSAVSGGLACLVGVVLIAVLVPSFLRYRTTAAT